MKFPTLFLVLSLAPISASQSTTTTPTNLPPPEITGTFTAGARVLIHNTTVSAAWSALTNFPAYATWNPFVRSAIVLSPLNITSHEQYPAVGKNLYMRTQIPPLPLPVNEHTPDNPSSIQLAYEEITHVDKDQGRLAWKYIAEALLQAERWQAISDAGDGSVLYESREIFAGPLSGVLEASMGEGLQKSFDAQGAGLKLLLEGGA